MPRPKNLVPKYRRHKPSGQAVVTIPTPNGRRDIYLGLFNSPESKIAYERVLSDLRKSHNTTAVTTNSTNNPAISVNEVLLAFIQVADPRHRDSNGKPTRELTEYKQCIRLVREHYGLKLARDFGPIALKALRQTMIDTGLARTLINRRINRIRRIFKWAASEELIPVAVPQTLATVTGLERGYAGVRETKPIEPVDEEVARAVMPFVRPEVAAMIELQLLTGMRPGEVCRLRPCEIDASGAIWIYRPQQHKSAWRGKRRSIPLGQQAQRVLAPFWPSDPDEFVFSPRRAIEQMHATRSANRKTPKYPSHVQRNANQRAAHPRRRPSASYTPCAYGHAVTRGVDRANAERLRSHVTGDSHGPNLLPIPHWHPNQLRHTFGTRVRKQYGLEAAQVALGHSRADVTQVYAERDLSLAVKVATEMG